MPGIRFLKALSVVIVLVGTMACGASDRPDLADDHVRELELGRKHAAQLVAEARRQPVSPEEAIQLGYLDRQRLGLGSPFRLMDYALRDPRLEEPTRRRLAWALLSNVIDGAGYVVDPVVLTRSTGGLGASHLSLIEGAVAGLADPRGGEQAARIAYAIAAAESSVDRGATRVAAQVAALIRDRELAREDGWRLLGHAESTGADPLGLIATWRQDRAFDVERPAMEPLSLDAERAAARLAPRLVEAIRTLSARAKKEPPAASAPVLPLLSRQAAQVLAEVAAEHDAPPQTPIAVAVDVHRRELLRDDLPAATRAALERFTSASVNEERLTAEYALLVYGAPLVRGVKRTTLWAAVAMRAYNQERPWFPGFGGPTVTELQDRFGLASVSFDEEVPGQWRPYYRRMFAHAIGDLQRVLPALDLRGLSIHFGENARNPATLALHDPRTRTVYLPPTTGAGTLAHEIAHDLDWQIALRRYRVRGDYGTDRATRSGIDRLAMSVRGLASGTLLAPDREVAMSHARRPAELFARNVDWFVAVSLARDDIVNGYLSSVQDDMLTGYGTVNAPDVTGVAGQALVAILDEVAPVYPETRRWFLESYGRDRAPSTYDLVRRVLESEIPALAEPTEEIGVLRPAEVGSRLVSLTGARDEVLSELDAWICRTPSAAYDSQLSTARRRLVALSAGARALGLVLEYAAEIGGPAARGWIEHRVHGPRWPETEVDPITAAHLGRLLDQARVAADAGISGPRLTLASNCEPPALAAGGW